MFFCQLGDLHNAVNKKKVPKTLLMGFYTVNNPLDKLINHTSGAFSLSCSWLKTFNRDDVGFQRLLRVIKKGFQLSRGFPTVIDNIRLNKSVKQILC